MLRKQFRSVSLNSSVLLQASKFFEVPEERIALPYYISHNITTVRAISVNVRNGKP